MISKRECKQENPFVNNIPFTAQWRLFKVYGIILHVFIPQKLCRSGRRFGFVWFPDDDDDAKRAVYRLNGFTFHGNRLGVNMARFKGRSSYWRKLRRKVPRGRGGGRNFFPPPEN